LIFTTSKEFTHFEGFNSITIPPTRIQYIKSIEGFTQLKEYCKKTYVTNGPVAIIVPFNYIYIVILNLFNIVVLTIDMPV
jgi:hypothetical protein